LVRATGKSWFSHLHLFAQRILIARWREFSSSGLLVERGGSLLVFFAVSAVENANLSGFPTL
jgi:hypothetical protein